MPSHTAVSTSLAMSGSLSFNGPPGTRIDRHMQIDFLNIHIANPLTHFEYFEYPQQVHRPHQQDAPRGRAACQVPHAGDGGRHVRRMDQIQTRSFLIPHTLHFIIHFEYPQQPPGTYTPTTSDSVTRTGSSCASPAWRVGLGTQRV